MVFSPFTTNPKPNRKGTTSPSRSIIDDSTAGKELINKIFNAKKVKYSLLQEILNKRTPIILDKKSHRSPMVNIYIDIESLLRPLYNKTTYDSISGQLMKVLNTDRFFLASEIANYVGHYRHFFASRYNVPTRIMAFYSFNKFTDGLSIDPTYREHYYNTRLGEASDYATISKNVRLNLNMVSTIFKYVPDVYLYNTGEIEPTLLPHFLLNLDQDLESYNFIISGNDIFYQDLLVKNKTYILNPAGDKTDLTDITDLTEKVFHSSKTKKEFSSDTDISPSLIPLVQVVTPHNILGYTKSLGRLSAYTAMKKLKTLSAEGAIMDIEYINPDAVYKAISSAKTKLFRGPVSEEEFTARFKLLNHRYMVDRYSKELLDIVGPNQTINLTDPASIKKLNSTNYFELNPIIIEYLFQGFDHSRFNY